MAERCKTKGRLRCASSQPGRVWLVCGLVAAIATLSVTAWAQTEAENKAAARLLGVEGIRLANEGDCEAAIDKLARAEHLYHAPTILGRLGECQVQVGLLVLGTENLTQVVREHLGPNPPEAFVRAQERAKQVLEQAQPKIAKLTVQVRASEGLAYRITVDGKELPSVLVGVGRPIDPGFHHLCVRGEGVRPFDQTVTLEEGGSEMVTLLVEPDSRKPPGDGPSAAASAASATSSNSDRSGDDGGETARLAGYVSLGVGGVGVAVGSVFGLFATGKKSELVDVCSGGRCPPSAEDDIDSMNTSATISTVGFGVGLVGLGLGAYLLLTGGQSEDAPASSGDAAAVRVMPWLGPGVTGLTARF